MEKKEEETSIILSSFRNNRPIECVVRFVPMARRCTIISRDIDIAESVSLRSPFGRQADVEGVVNPAA